MSLANGTLTFFRLFYNEKINPSVADTNEILKEYSFENLFDNGKPINYGFTPLNYPNNRFFDETDIIFDNSYCFSIRIDEKKLSKKYFEIRLQEMQYEFLKENSKEHLSKSDKEFIKNALTTKLTRETLPNTSLIEVIWSADLQEVFLSSLTDKTFEAAAHLFKLSFDIGLYRDTFMASAKKNIKVAYKIDDIQTVPPAQF